jgi:hypothetical protein
MVSSIASRSREEEPMKIGEYKRTVTVEPVRSPIPKKEEARPQVDRPRPDRVPAKARA